MIGFDDVSVVFPGGVRALDRVSLSLDEGVVAGLVGESGSGKTTLCRVLLGLQPPTSGRVTLGGTPIDTLIRHDRLAYRRRMQMLLQDAAASLSPRMRVRALVEEPLRIHGLPLAEGRARILTLLARLGLSPALLDATPNQLSGGQARRVAMLRALILEPRIVIADEPTAGLDVSVQGELLNLMRELHAELGLTYLIVSHNLSVVRRVTSRVVVMYLGEIVEIAPTADLFDRPAHPYTAALLSTHPAIDPAHRRERIVLQGEIPSPVNPPGGCRFHTRCPQAQPRCRSDGPALATLGPSRSVRCHFPLE